MDQQVIKEFLVLESFTVTNSGNGAYVIDGSNNPTLNLLRGFTYTFNINASGHPFYIKTSQTTGTGNQYTSGVTGNGTQSGTLTFAVPYNAPSTLYYICQYHLAMKGTISISDVIQTGAQGAADILFIKDVIQVLRVQVLTGADNAGAQGLNVLKVQDIKVIARCIKQTSRNHIAQQME